MDLDYVKQLENQNENLKNKLASLETAHHIRGLMIENQKSLMAGREYEFTSYIEKMPLLFRREYLRFTPGTPAKNRKAKFKDLITDTLFNHNDIMCFNIRCERHYIDFTECVWMIDLELMADNKWYYTTVRTNGRESFNTKIPVDWLNKWCYNNCVKEKNEQISPQTKQAHRASL